jgi:fucose 4-O-acetylase-like acetyltransferase
MSTVLSPKRLTRDPFIDLLRTCAILVVACGHWIMPVLQGHGGTLTAGNSLATPGWWLLTWPLQVMPVFFFAGGAANYHSYTRSGDARAWLAARLCRLAVPVLPLLAVWLVVPSLLRGLGVPSQPVALGAGIVGQLLWFLAVYVLTVAAVPLLHRRGLGLAVGLGIAAVGVDALRFHGVPLVGYVNEMLVWLAVSQLGFAYADGRLARLTRSGAAALGCAGFATTILLVLFGHYPTSMVGLPGQVSNMAPATVCLLCLGVGQIGVLLALRESIVRWSGHSRLLRTVGSRSMTVYLWHMPAMVVVAGIAVLGFGYATPAPGSPLWLAVTPLWIGALALVLSLLVRAFGRFEGIRPADGAPSGRRLVAAVLLLCVGFTGIAAFGFTSAVLALPWAASILAGLALAWPHPHATATRWLGRLLDVVFS